MADAGYQALTVLGSSFCTICNFRIRGNSCHHSRTVGIPYLQKVQKTNLRLGYLVPHLA